MNIKLAIIDHAHASIEVREKFSFSENAARDAISKVVQDKNIKGCVIISTCNRTEIYISAKEQNVCPSPFDIICGLKNAEKQDFEMYFEELCEHEVAQHLFELTCGMKSKIFGEDQIISQVKDAMQMSRDENTLDSKLELLFKSAITCAKRIKTDIKLSVAEHSLADSTISLLLKEGYSFENTKALVIGNGEMGRLVARALIAHNICTFMTIRKYRHGDVLIPAGCKIIDYEDRMEFLKDVDIVISATRSPHLTVKCEDIRENFTKTKLFLDLALPRDIDKNINNLQNAKLYDIDFFETKGSTEAIEKARMLINDGLEQMKNTYRFKKMLPLLRDITEDTAEYVSERVQTRLSDEQTVLYIEDVTKKAVAKLIYGIRDNLNSDDWQKCIEAMKKGVSG